MKFKTEIHIAFMELINNKITALQNELNELFETGKNETKSTAGDKHETALAMIQIEQENIRRKIKDSQEQKIIFDNINPDLTSAEVRKGSLVKTNKGYFFIAAGIGKINVNNETITAISIQSPLGQKLFGKKVNDSAEINGIQYLITGIE